MKLSWSPRFYNSIKKEKKKSSVKLRKWFQNQGSGVGSVSKAVHAHNSRAGTELTSGFLGLNEKLKLNS